VSAMSILAVLVPSFPAIPRSRSTIATVPKSTWDEKDAADWFVDRDDFMQAKITQKGRCRPKQMLWPA
jgi:hypothetical protein